ncbi:MAG: FHA domain-containing protein, partial [Polyangiaceae bacterium]|nr:FHA domain-containing protein [Polyangiaceae bacterium]
MWKLTIEDDEGQRTSLDLGQHVYSIGRSPESTIRLTERNVSRRHIVLRYQDSPAGWTIEDLGSYNGTYVNGQRLSGAQPLKSGDVIQLADYRMVVADQAGAAAEAPQAPAEQRRPDRLIVVIGPKPGVEFPLRGERVSIGRAEEATISINHASVSRMHAELVTLGQGRWEVIDQGSSNGIRINGQDLRRGIIEQGDALELGDVRLRFIGAGKWLRPTADPGLLLAAFAGDAAQKPSKRGGKIAAAVVVLAGIAVGVWLLVRQTATTQATTVGGGPEDPCASQVLVEAVALAETDVFAAHERALSAIDTIAECADLTALEVKWAEAMFAKAEATTDVVEKRRLLNQINATRTVPKELRNKAVDLIVESGAEPEPVPEPTGKAGTGLPPYHPPSTATVPGTQPKATTTTSSTPATSATGSVTPPAGFDPGGNRKALEPKVWSTGASCDDIKMLRALCSQQG